jgi:uncharacterized protein YgiB involved in biofilm formation
MTAKNTSTAGAEAAEQAQETAPKFTVERLAVDCRQLFGVSSCTYAGATHGMTGEYTVEEMKAHIKEWCSKEVK